jgi:hypothetical protein
VALTGEVVELRAADPGRDAAGLFRALDYDARSQRAIAALGARCEARCAAPLPAPQRRDRPRHGHVLDHGRGLAGGPAGDRGPPRGPAGHAGLTATPA